MFATGVDVYIIFGAKVVDGQPSPALRRRVEGAFAQGGTRSHTRYLVTGGGGPPGEADVMARLLIERGVPDHVIVRERDSTDTLDSARACARLLAGNSDARNVIVCSSRYHIPRCRLLLWQLGIRTQAGDMPSDLEHLGLAEWLFYVVREAVAIPYDAALALQRR
jgi:uncharacterized SAM-binding protein YcdF (DUF218 family)